MKSLRKLEGDDADGCACCVQWTLLLVNIPLLLMGIVLVGLGSWTIAQRAYIGSLQLDSGGFYLGLVAIMIVAGIVLVVTAVLGCAAAFMETRTALIIYYALVVGIFLFLCISILLGYVYRMRIANTLRQELKTSAAAYDPARTEEAVTKAWDKMQRSLQCCGVAPAGGATAPWLVWQTNKMLNSGDADSRVPNSCCLAQGTSGEVTNCSPGNAVNPALIYTADCFTSASSFFRGHVQSLVICCIVFGVMLILAATLAICLYFLAD